jgi:hypothetical protein
MNYRRALHPKAESRPWPETEQQSKTLNGILVGLKTGCTWEDVPRVCRERFESHDRCGQPRFADRAACR